MATAKKTAGSKPAAKTKESEGTPLTSKLAGKLAELGIEATTEEEARAIVTKKLAAGGINGMENDSLEDLIDIVSAFPADELEEEEAAPAPPKKGAGKKQKQPEPEEETGEEEEEEELEEAAEEEEEEATPKTKGKGKPAPVVKAKTKQQKDEEEIEELVEEVEAGGLAASTKKNKANKKAAKGGTRARKLEGKRWETLTDAEKTKAVKPIRALLPEKQYRIDFLTRSFIVKFLGKASEHSIFKYHLLRLLPDGKLEGIFVTHKFKDPDEFREFLPDDLGAMKLHKGDACSYIHPFHLDQLLELIKDTKWLEESLNRATKQDGRMDANHKKLSNQLEQGNKESNKKGAASAAPNKKGNVKAADVTEEEELEEEEAPPAPKKKTVVVTTKLEKGAKSQAPAAIIAKAKAPAEKESAAPAKPANTKKAAAPAPTSNKKK